MNTETIELLKEINSGCKAAVDSMDQVRTRITSPELKKIAEDCGARHTGIGEKCRKLLGDAGLGECNPTAVGMTMAHIGTEVKLAVDSGDKHIAKMLSDGAAMGIRSISQVLNNSPEASPESRGLAKELIAEEKGFFDDMMKFV